MRVDQSRDKYVMALIRVIQQAPSVADGCRRVGIHRSTYYRWMGRIQANEPASGVGGAGPRVRSPYRVRLEAQVVALSLANPPWGPAMLFHHLRLANVDIGSPAQVWRILKHHGLNKAAFRYETMRLAMGLDIADQITVPSGMHRPPIGTLDADIPGDLVQFDCFHIGRVKGAKIVGHGQGTVWQYTAIDVASSYVWAQTHTTRHNPSPTLTTGLAHRVATDLAKWGWQFKAATTDNGNEFRAALFTNSLQAANIKQRFIRPGRPQTNGKVEQVQNTILRELWHPTFTTYAEPSITSLRKDLHDYLEWYNNKRPHTGRWNQGRPPTEIIEPNPGNYP